MAAMADIEAQSELPMSNDGVYLKYATREVRLGFIRKVYGILTMQLVATVAIAAPLHQMSAEWFQENVWLLQVSLIGSLGAVISLACCPSVGRRFPINYIALLCFTVCEAVLVGVISAGYTSGTVLMCAGITAAIFLCMTAYAWKTQSDFTGAGPYLIGCLFALLAFGFTISIMSAFGVKTSFLGTIYAGVGVVLFTLYIVYDTQLILGEFKGHRHSFGIDDYVFAALNLYVDIVNLFLDLLRLLADRR